ncbi:MAG: FG-GAP repeat protein, partial [Deltaproteobacteria bacterium]|nr:FG-GAP repeat protein [Deltaproteobacteria bacterium]
MKARVGWLSYLFLILVGLFLVFCGEDSGIDKRPPEFGTVRDIPAGDSSFGTTSKMLLESSPSWTNERDQTGAYYGYSVANAGDVNGDGYTDVLVGAPYFDNGQTNEGRAFLFLGGPTGPSATPSWTTESDQAEAQFGYSVASAGDVNGDGYADVLVGAPFYDNGETDEGRVYLFLGSASGLATTPAWTAEGNQAGARFGTSIASAGDVDGDGDSDVIIGAPYFDNGQADEGMAFVYQGTPGGLSALPAWSAESNQAGAQFGYSVASAGDVQRDGYADIVVGAPYYTNGESFEGWVGVFHGSASGPSPTPNWTTESNQANALYGNSVASAGDVQGDGYSDLIVGAYLFDNGETDEGRAFLYVGSAAGLAAAPAWTAESNQAGAQFGWAVAGAGDVNGDGFADVVIGANLYDNGQTDEGRAYLYRGGSSGLATTAGWTAESNQAGAYFGHAVAGVGDANGDGFGDVLFGTYLYDGGQTDEGRTYLYRGLATGLSGSDWNTWGEASYDEFGYSIAGAGDVNGDGYGDVIVGAPYGGTSDEGRAYVYLGGTSGLNSTPIWTAESDQSSAYFGLSVAGAGDVNGDGYADVVVGAPNFNNGETDEGRAYLYLGSATGPSSTPAWTAESNQAYAEFGYSVAGAGDVNGDGYADVVVGARYYDNGQSSEGKAFLYLGSAAGLASTPTWTAESNQDTAYFGYSVAGAGDVNGDGYADVIIGARLYDNGQTDEGRAYVYLGGASGLSTTPAWTAESNQSSADFGFSVAGAGDVNGDGYADVIVGARYFNNGETDEGRAYLYLGSASGLSTTPDWTAEADKSYSNFGASVAGAGDVNGDGYGDVLVGAPNYDGSFTNEGMAYLFLGSATGLSSTASWTNGGWESNQYFGYPVASLGDANGDGFGDVAVAAPWENYPSTDAGNAYAFFGGDLGYTGKALGLKQFKADGATRIAVGGTSGGSTVILKGRAFNPSSLGGKVRLEVEVAPIGQPFAGAGLVRSTAVLPGDEAIVTVPGLTGGPQRWRARTVFPGAQGYGRWSSFGGNTEAEADFVVPLPLGAICPNGSICASGFCVDGVCCDGACSALCMACTAGKKGSGTDGTCGFIASGADPDDDCANDGASSCQKDGTCDGSGACRLYAGGTVCRAAAGPCDAVENCPGGGAPCPPDALEPNTTVCRAAAGGCDALEYCTGISINCPSDAYQPSTVECRPSAGFCDVAEFCPGSSVNCPADAFQPSSVECRASAGVCDVAENCTGWSAVCPLDTYQPNTVTCRSATGLCDVAENCPGTSADCPADALRPNTFECRASAGVCDLAENCTGSSV